MNPDYEAQHNTSADTEGTVYALVRALNAVRRRHNITQTRLAEQLAVTTTDVAEWESGTNDPPTVNLLAWAHALGYAVRVVDTSATSSPQTQQHTDQPVDIRELYHPLAQALRTAREHAGLRQHNIAKKLGVGLSTINQWESAERIPSLAHLTAWAETLDCLLELNEWNPTPATSRTTPHAAPPAREPIPPPDTPHTPAPPTPQTTGQHNAPETRTGRHHVTMPALPAMARPLREAAAHILAGHPRRDDAKQVTAVFATIPILEHRCTCCPPAPITLTVDNDQHRVRLEIKYHLALSHPPRWTSEDIDAYSFGLALVNGHSDRWGTSVRQASQTPYGDKNLTWWAELDHTPQPPPPASDTDQNENA